MKIAKTQTDNCLTIALEGRLDTTSSPELEKEIDADLAGIPEPGRRFKGEIWLMGRLDMAHRMPDPEWPLPEGGMM